jgi:iron complex transport system ATP-binding protein
MISFERLTVAVGKTVLLSDVTFAATPGGITAVIGHNGGGKSTLLRTAAGLMPPMSGRVNCEGRVAFMPQGSGEGLPLTVRQTVLLGRIQSLSLRLRFEDLAAADAMLDRFGILDLADRRLDRISGGQRQLAFLAQTMMQEPDVLLLDEPTSALDIGNQLAILDIVAELTSARQLTTLIAIHDVATAARIAGRIAIISRGRLVAAGAPKAVLTRAMFAEVYGVDAHMCEMEHGAPALHIAGRIMPPAPPAAHTPSS